MEKTTTTVNFKNLLENKLSNSSLQFFSKPIKSKRYLIKALWILFLIMSLYFSIYNIIINFIDYFSYDTITSIHTYNEREAEFPTISFCDPDINEYYFNIKILQFTFNSQNYTSTWQEHLEIYNDTSFGQCYRFNSGKSIQNESMAIKKSKKAGYDDGFILEFYSATKHDYGQIYVYIHNHTQNPATIFNKGYWIRAGTDTYFILKRVFDQRLEKPFNNCFKNVSHSPFNQTIINYMNKKEWEYNQRECVSICRNLIAMETTNCNCNINSLDEKFKVKCFSKNVSDEIKKCSEKFLIDFNSDLCIPYCPLECDSFNYDIAQTIVPIIDNGNITSVQFQYTEFNTYENVSKSLYQLYVYYDDLKYTVISQKPKTELYGLISNIGGTFSLFLGLSIGSFLELLEALGELLFIFFDYS